MIIQSMIFVKKNFRIPKYSYYRYSHIIVKSYLSDLHSYLNQQRNKIFKYGRNNDLSTLFLLPHYLSIYILK